jgi:LPXTG-site transpeptidase (sortase) family protein
VALALALIALLISGPPESVARAQGITGTPVRLVVPSVQVDATVGAFELNDDLSMPVPQVASLVAWYTYSGPAGGYGNVVLAGHRDWEHQRGVFYSLDDVADGDEVWLQDAAGVWYRYQVVWTLSMPDDRAPVDAIAGLTAAPSVTLITCSGTFDRGVGRYLERRIVRAELTDVIPPPASGSDGHSGV